MKLQLPKIGEIWGNSSFSDKIINYIDNNIILGSGGFGWTASSEYHVAEDIKTMYEYFKSEYKKVK